MRLAAMGAAMANLVVGRAAVQRCQRPRGPCLAADGVPQALLDGAAAGHVLRNARELGRLGVVHLLRPRRPHHAKPRKRPPDRLTVLVADGVREVGVQGSVETGGLDAHDDWR